MDHSTNQGKEPLRQPRAEQAHSLAHRASNVSAISDNDDSIDRHMSNPSLHPAISKDSLYDRHGVTDTEDESRRYTPYSPPGSALQGSLSFSNSQRYAPLSRSVSKASRASSQEYALTLNPAILEAAEEETYDLSLLKSAAPMGTRSMYEPVQELDDDDEEEDHLPAVFDVTALGPATAQDEEFLKGLQAQEAKGTLTGGLGQGFRPDTTVRDAELLATQSPVQRTLTRTFTRRRTKKATRSETIKHMGQDEANRRGQVIEVIMEEPAEVDISSMGGLSVVASSTFRNQTYQSKEGLTRIFYPQPNWKPWSMRWPYLSILVLVSVGLAIMQEFMFRKYRHRPLLEFKSPNEVNPALYFAVKFAPTLSAVVYGVLWQFTDFEVRRLEAFYQMSTDDGALASESINVDYVTSFTFLLPFRALKVRHFSVAFSSIATTFAISLVPTFAAASVVITPSRQERMAHPDGLKALHFSPIWSRLLTSTLSFCAFCACCVLFSLQTRRSGLLGDVRGIAGLASMAVVSHILNDFRDMDTATHYDIHHRLKRHRYMLKNSSLAPDDDNPLSSKDRDKHSMRHRSDNPHPLMLRAPGLLPFIGFLIGFLLFIPIFLFTKADIITDKAPWFITAWSVCLKLAWTGMEKAVRMMEPYYILSRRHAPSKTLTLDYTALPFGYLPFRALLNGHIMVFLVGFGTVMFEFLTILVTGLATVDGRDFLKDYSMDPGHPDKANVNSGQETVLSFNVSLGISLFILLYMTVVATVVFLRRRHAFLPRQPNTIASVLAYIHQSKMLWNFVGTAKLSNAQMVRKLEDGKTYGLGWFDGRDGQQHCGVDEEELKGNYKHGINMTEATDPWATAWDRF